MIVFGDLDDQCGGRHGRIAQRLDQARQRQPVHHLDQGVGTEIEEQALVLRLRGPRAQALAQASLLEFEAAILGARGLEQGIGRAQRRVARAANQAFVAHHGAILQLHDGLVVRPQRAAREDLSDRRQPPGLVQAAAKRGQRGARGGIAHRGSTLRVGPRTS
jgi:hypothetical protein